MGQVTALDCDRVELKNLARQFLYSEAEVGQPKLGRAVARARAFNSELRITPVERWVTGPDDVAPLLPGADLVLSAIDQPAEVQEWVNDACVAAGVPFITGGMQVARGCTTRSSLAGVAVSPAGGAPKPARPRRPVTRSVSTAGSGRWRA